MADAAPPPTKTPADFLRSIKGRSVIVKLNSGVEYRGAHERAASTCYAALLLVLAAAACGAVGDSAA